MHVTRGPSKAEPGGVAPLITVGCKKTVRALHAIKDRAKPNKLVERGRGRGHWQTTSRI